MNTQTLQQVDSANVAENKIDSVLSTAIKIEREEAKTIGGSFIRMGEAFRNARDIIDLLDAGGADTLMDLLGRGRGV